LVGGIGEEEDYDDDYDEDEGEDGTDRGTGSWDSRNSKSLSRCRATIFVFVVILILIVIPPFEDQRPVPLSLWKGVWAGSSRMAGVSAPERGIPRGTGLWSGRTGEDPDYDDDYDED
jgi:hypothetical protein